jgi:hypothetical protein
VRTSRCISPDRPLISCCSDASVTDDHSVVVTICGVNQEDRTLEEALEEAFCPPAYDLGLDFEDPLFWPSEKVSIGLKDVKWDGPGDFQYVTTLPCLCARTHRVMQDT